jgi:hypothetical protein
MKNLLLLTAGCLFFTLTKAQTSASNSEPRIPEKFCLMHSEGKSVVIHNGNQLDKPARIAKGAKITPEGTIIWKDKTRTALQPGQCVDETGSIFNPGSGNENEKAESSLDDVNILPEVTIADNLLFNDLLDSTIAERADDFFQNSFIVYALRSRTQILSNERIILQMKDKLALSTDASSKKLVRQINSLEKENLELKNDLIRFLHLGKGSWKNFSNEFSEDLKPLVQDIAELQSKVD